jgi:hypothetical protein
MLGNIEHMPRKAAINEWSQFKREAMWAPKSKATGAGCPSPLELRP